MNNKTKDSLACVWYFSGNF